MLKIRKRLLGADRVDQIKLRKTDELEEYAAVLFWDTMIRVSDVVTVLCFWGWTSSVRQLEEHWV
jgi:hypothetical protein